VVLGPLGVRGRFPGGPRAGHEITKKYGSDRSAAVFIQSDSNALNFYGSFISLQFNSMSLISFWIKRSCEYPLLSEKAVNVLLPFATTYLCETAFSAVTAMKTKHRSRLNIEHDIRVCLSRISPRLDKLCGAKQAQPSH